MSATTIGGLIGAALDGLSGDDGVGDGAAEGAIAANVIAFVAPVIVTYAIGWAVLRGVRELRTRAFGGGNPAK